MASLLGREGLSEAFRLNWVRPHYEEGFLMLTDSATLLSEIRRVAALVSEKIQVGDNISGFTDDDGTKTNAQITGVETTPDGTVKSVRVKRSNKPGEVVVAPKRLPPVIISGVKTAP